MVILHKSCGLPARDAGLVVSSSPSLPWITHPPTSSQLSCSSGFLDANTGGSRDILYFTAPNSDVERQLMHMPIITTRHASRLGYPDHRLSSRDLLPQAAHILRSTAPTIRGENGKPQVRPRQVLLLQQASICGGQSPGDQYSSDCLSIIVDC